MKAMQKNVSTPVIACVFLLIGALSESAIGQDSQLVEKSSPEVSAASSPSGTASEAKTESKLLGRRHEAKWWGADVTPGWAMMTWKERNEHRKKMHSMASYADCKRYIDEHHSQMVERAKARGKSPMAEPKRDACADLK